MKPRQFYLVRHAESVANVSQGAHSLEPTDGDRLSEMGWIQTEHLAKRLANTGFTKIITSPMRRTQETAHAVGERLKLPVEISNEIYETRQADAFYNAVGEAKKRLSAAVWMAEHPDDPDYKMAEAESFRQVVQRVQRFKTQLLAQPDEKTLVISHGNFLRFFLGDTLLGENFHPPHFMNLWNAKAMNTGISIFDYDEPHEDDGYIVQGWRLLTWMEDNHIPNADDYTSD